MNNVLIYRGPVVGLSHHSYGLYMKEINVGDHVVLERDPCNSYNSGAVKVLWGEDQIGWIPNAHCAAVSCHLERLKNVAAIVTNHDLYGDFSKRLYIQVYDQDAPAANWPTAAPLKEPVMTAKNSTIIESLVANNTATATSAAFLEAGRLANNAAAKTLAKRAPLLVRGYVDTPVGKLVIANLAQLAIQQFRPGEAALNKLGEAMLVEAWQAVYGELQIEEMIAEILDNSTVKRAVSKLAKEK
jgi:hypothetical protein